MTGPGLFTKIADAITGVPPGLFDPEEARYARSRGLFAAGQALLTSPGTPYKPSPFDMIGHALGTLTGAGQQGGLTAIQQYESLIENARKRAVQKKRDQLLAQYSGASTDEEFNNLVSGLVQIGDYEGAKTVSEAIKNMRDPAGKALKEVDVGDHIELVDPVKGSVVRMIPKTANPNAANPQRDDATQMYGQFLQQTLEHRNVATAFRRLRAAYDRPSAAGDIALLTGFMKMVDPGSTVREGEFATAQNATGVPDWIRAQYNRLLNGERLTPNRRLDFFEQAKGMASEMRDSQNTLIEQMRQRAIAGGIDPDKYQVSTDFFKGIDFNVTKNGVDLDKEMNK